MTFRGGKFSFSAGTASAMLALLCAPALAQDSGGLEAEFTFSSGLTYSDNDGTAFQNNLGVGLSSETRAQRLAIDISASLEEHFDTGSPSGLVDPRAALSYGIESRQTELTADLSYRQADADGFTEDLDGELGDLVLDEGNREDTGAKVGLTFGRDAPFGGNFNLGFRETNFTDTTSPDLIDSQTTTAALGLRFEIDPRIIATLDYDRTQTNRETDRNTLSESLSAGVELAITPTLDANVSLGFSSVNVNDAGTQTTQDGVSYSIGLTQDRPTGALRYSLASDLSEAGRRTTATAGGTFETRRGEFSADVGLSSGTDNDIRPTLSLSYTEDLPRGSYAVSLSQKFDVDSDGDETLNSRLRLNWRQDLTRTARIASSLTYQSTDVLGADEDADRLELGLTYSQDLTEQWAITTRYTHSLVHEDGAATTSENEIFLGIETTMQWRP